MKRVRSKPDRISEIEAAQASLRTDIAATDRLIEKTDALLARAHPPTPKRPR